MGKRPYQSDQELSTSHNKRHKQICSIDNTNVNKEISKDMTRAKIEQRKRKIEERKQNQIIQEVTKRRCLQHDRKHAYLSSPHGMVYFSSEQIQYLKETYEQRSYLGIPKYTCKYCNAIFWFEERNKYDTERGHGEILYSNCCKYGRIKIPPFKEPPEFLKRLLDHKGDGYSRHFLQKIRQYNSMFAFTSMGGNIDKTKNQGEGPYVFRINGQVHHRIGSLLPEPNKIPKFAELYIFDTKNEIQNRIRAISKEDPDTTDLNPDRIRAIYL